jgi:hypothetical protein
MDFIYTPVFGIAVFAVAYTISRIIHERALRRLSTEEKARLIDGFSGFRIFTAVVVLLFVVLFFAGSYFFPELTATMSLGFPVAILLILIFLNFITYRKLSELKIPESYIKTYLFSLALQYFGLAALFLPNIFKNFS